MLGTAMQLQGAVPGAFRAAACHRRVAAAPQRRAAPCPATASAGGGASSNGSAPPAPLVAGPTVVTDAAVPEGHQGLHGFLYGEGGAESEHGGSSGYAFREVRAEAVVAVVGGWLGVARVLPGSVGPGWGRGCCL
jgi:hypothetical protein